MGKVQRKKSSPGKQPKLNAVKYSLTAMGFLLLLGVGSIVVLGVFSTLNEEWPVLGEFMKSLPK